MMASAQSSVQEAISEELIDSMLRGLNLTAALIEVLRALQGEGIDAIPYKGPVLAAQAYGDAALREFDDVDIIVRQRDMARVHRSMAELGYLAKFPASMSPEMENAPTPGEYKYYGEARAAIVELPTERTLRHFPVTPDMDEFLQRCETVNVGGHEVRTLSREDTLLAICVHGSKDFWARLSWIADVSELVQRSATLDWEQITRRAKRLQVERMLHAGLLLAVRMLGVPVPAEVAREVEGDKAAEAVAMDMACRLLCRAPRSPGAGERFQARRKLAPGFLSGWRYAVRLTMAPAEEDWKTMKLPRARAPLYVLLRPFRLARKYTQPT